MDSHSVTERERFRVEGSGVGVEGLGPAWEFWNLGLWVKHLEILGFGGVEASKVASLALVRA